MLGKVVGTQAWEGTGERDRSGIMEDVPRRGREARVGVEDRGL